MNKRNDGSNTTDSLPQPLAGERSWTNGLETGRSEWRQLTPVLWVRVASGAITRLPPREFPAPVGGVTRPNGYLKKNGRMS